MTEIIELDGDWNDFQEYAEEQGWADGLPLVPPTPDRVEEMLRHTDRDARDVIGLVPPRWAEATVEKVAVNAVMAGCRPEYLPVLITAVEAALEKEFNLYGIQATTNPVAPMLIVHGPVREELRINYRSGCLGPGWRANATLGRALRLILLNVGGAAPGPMDKATAGQPGKYTFCTGENSDDSPWPPLHAERGLPSDVSAVTVVGASGTLNVLDMGSATGQGILTSMASCMAFVGSNDVLYGGQPLVLFSPEHARLIAQAGFSRSDVQRFLYDQARVPLGAFAAENRARVLQRLRPRFYDGLPETAGVTVAESPADILVAVAGGPGPHSVYIPTFGDTRAVTRPIARRDGTPVRLVAELRRQ